MPYQEIPWRIFEKLKKHADQKTKFQAPGIGTELQENIFRLSTHFSPEKVKPFKQDTDRLLSVAGDAMENRIDIFGRVTDYGNPPDWHLDPISKKQWPVKFWGDIDIRDRRFGGVKFVWEMSRFYGLLPLAFAYRLTGDKSYADKILSLIHSWVAQNPYPVGINWASGIESAVRLANLIWALSFLAPYPFSRDDFKAINAFVNFNTLRIYRYPSKYSSANNHLLAEGFGLFLAGLYFPYLAGAPEWFAKGRTILEDEISRQILPDGGCFEYSTTYLSFVFDFFLLYRICCRSNEIGYRPKIDERLEKSWHFINSLKDAKGNIPNLGDQDSAILVNFGLDNHENFHSILNTGALLFKSADIQTDRKDLKTFLLTGREHPPCKTLQTELSPCVTFHKYSGIAIIKDRVQDKEIMFTGHAMPMGLAPLYAHGHLDALSFTLSVGGKEIIVDPGTYLYHNSGEWRSYFRSTAAHNTLRLNKKEFSRQTGDFMFSRAYQITEHSLEQTDTKIIWQAGHDAYAKAPPFADVVRRVTWEKERNLIQLDDMVDTKSGTVAELFFHFHPGCKVDVENPGTIDIKRNDIRIMLFYDTRFQHDILCGSKNPVAGWFSPGFNQIEKSTTVRLYNDFKQLDVISTRLIIQNGLQ